MKKLAQMQGMCASCKHYLGEVDGFCRRYPPQVVVGPDEQDNIVPLSIFPIVAADDSCGEFYPVD